MDNAQLSHKGAVVCRGRPGSELIDGTAKGFFLLGG